MKYQAIVTVKIDEKCAKTVEFPVRDCMEAAMNDEDTGRKVWEETLISSKIQKVK